MSGQGYGCRICRRVISRYIDETGKVAFRHPLADLHHYDHDPQPAAADRIAGGVIRACDFCADDDVIVWLYRTPPITMLALGDSGSLATDYGTTWGACPACASILQERDLARLHDLNCRKAGVPKGGPAADMAGQMLSAVLADLRPGRQFLLDGTGGPPPDLPPRLLPKIRDRLAVLLHPGNDFATLPDPATKPLAHVASTVDISRLYALDTLYTDMATAAAQSLPPVGWASVPVPSPDGFLLWSHPADSTGDVAVAWATDGTRVHVVLLRALGSRLTGVQEQLLREQAGWLVPTAAFTLEPHELLDAAHPAAVVLTSFLLIAHRLTETTSVTVDKKVRAAYARAKRPVPEVRLVHLRPSAAPAPPPEPASGDNGSSRRECDHRWWVPAFVRNQACGPGRTDRKPKLIMGHINGPIGKPVKASTIVRLLAQPKTKHTKPSSGQMSHVDGER